MRLRTALDAYKRDAGPFPGTAPTHDGALAGDGDRLVHVAPDGAVRDHSAALSGRYGVDRSRFGLRADGETHWFDDATPDGQRYVGDTRLVETSYDLGDVSVRQRDLTLGRAHLTRFTLDGPVPADARLHAFVTFAPTGRDRGVGRLVHRDGPTVVETYGREERDYLAAAPAIETVEGQVPERFDELLAAEPVAFPRPTAGERYEAAHLGGDVLVEVPLARDGAATHATLATLLCDAEMERATAVETVRSHAETHADGLRAAAESRDKIPVPVATPVRELIRADLRALELLRAPTGVRIAGPEFDHFTVSSGGYGYTWFRDDAEIVRRLLTAADTLGLDVDAWLSSAATVYVDTQRSDGSWPHRVWAADGSLAPGWANARLGDGDDAYQADQTASVVACLATLVAERPAVLADRDATEAAVAAGVDALVETLADDGLPARCQNLWENAHGRFAHTAATYLDAFARVAAAPVDEPVRRQARECADQVLAGLDALWTGDAYGMAVDDGRLDAGTFALADALAAREAVTPLPERHLDRFERHLWMALDGLSRRSPSVAGLVRFEGDEWRRAGQTDPKVWSVATAWGAVATLRGADLLAARGRSTDGLVERGRELYELVGSEGPFASEVGLLAEQAFDDGRLDSATPLGWSHALRLDATALLVERGAFADT